MSTLAKKIINSHNVLRIATFSENDSISVRTVYYACDLENESKLYFITFNYRAKTKEINKNSTISFVIDKEVCSLEATNTMQYLKGKGEAHQVLCPEEIQKGIELLITKFPFLCDFSGDPTEMSVFRIDVDEFVVHDNTLGFGHTDILKCS